MINYNICKVLTFSIVFKQSDIRITTHVDLCCGMGVVESDKPAKTL